MTTVFATYWNGLVNLMAGLTSLTVTGLDTASSQGAGWSSLESASKG
ncbi:hypothetical protein [Rhodococcus sp. NPDC059234]